MFKTLLKKIIPPMVLNLYHKTLAYLGALIYGKPSEKLIVIGVTGTNGKSTVVNLLSFLLEKAGFKTGVTSTVSFKVADQHWLNDKKMTMLGRLATQKLLSQMVKAGCHYAIIETSSEGIKQFRHLAINYDFIIFTNLTPEHLEAHGGFDNYKKAKGELFRHLTQKKKKVIKSQVINKVTIINADDQYAEYFLNFEADKKITYSINQTSDYRATEIQLKSNGSFFEVNNQNFKTNLIGQVNIYNCLAAIACLKEQNIPDEKIKPGLLKYAGLAGRYEFIDQGQDFKVMVDYAPEPESLKHLYETLKLFSYPRLIHVLGSCGGGRDQVRRPVLGRMAGAKADLVIVTNEDPYNEDPQTIIDQVAQGAIESGKVLEQNLFKISDRREAINFALSQAKENDFVLITGKGSEQFICLANGKKIPWDDRKVVRELLK